MLDMWKWMQDANWTPGELSSELGIPRDEISAILAKEKEPDKIVQWALAGLSSSGPKRNPRKLPNRRPTVSLAPPLADDTWASETARLILPILVEMATSGQRKTITYRDLHSEVIRRGGKSDIGTLTKYAFPCGRVARAVSEDDDENPPLTALVVSGTSGLPSQGIDGFIRGYLGRTDAKGIRDPHVRRKIIEGLWNEIYAFQNWPEVMLNVGLTGDPLFDI